MNLKSFKRKQVILSQEELTKTEFLQSEQYLPLVIKPVIDGINLTNWAFNNQEWIETQLFKYGGLLFRNFNIHEIDGIEAFIQTISGELIEYSYRSTPRSQVSGKIYTSTEYPPNNQFFYTTKWPTR